MVKVCWNLDGAAHREVREANDPYLPKEYGSETQSNENDLGEWTDTSQFIDAMADGSQTLTEANTPTAEVLKSKQKTWVATLNVRTLNQVWKLAQVVKEFDEFRLEILAWLKSEAKVRQEDSSNW